MKKQKTCRSCKEKFTPTQFAQVVCSPRCAIKYTNDQKAKKEKKELATDRAVFKLNDKKVQRVLAQKAFNRFIRMRDAKLPCISCGTTNDVIYCAGHYRSRGAIATLSFEELNVHKQCNKHCNLEKSGNVGEYRIALIKKIGLEKLEWLEGPHEPVKYSAEDYVAIKKKYLRKCQEMES
jgi:hypothetical protein